MKNKKKKNNRKAKLGIALNYIKESRKEIYIGIILFIFFIFIGFIFSSSLSFLDKYLAEIMSKTKDLSRFPLFWFILKNNVLTSFISLFLGIILCFMPIFNAITNGLVIGYVIKKVALTAGYLELWKLIPHGIFELPAIFISIGLGIKLGKFIFKKDPLDSLKEYSYKSILVFILVVIPLLIIAALIEFILIIFAK
jgi:stage II sporulation protein M